MKLDHVYSFSTIDSKYGKFIVNRNDHYQPNLYRNAGSPHIEGELLAIFKILDDLPTCCVVVDVGANAGFVTVPVAKYIAGKNGRVISFEPQKMMAYSLCGTVALNDLHNVEVIQKGVGKSKTTLRLPNIQYKTHQDFGTATLRHDNDGVEVDIVAIDDLGLPRIDFLKIDAEGMELEVLDGAMDSIKRYRPHIWAEHLHTTTKAIADFFNINGLQYDCKVMDHLNTYCKPQ